LKINFLGTGTSQGVPVIACKCKVCSSLDFRDKRLRASVYIEVDGQSLVIDSGPDFRHQILRENITNLDALIFTHEHKDHTAGMDDIRAFNYKDKRSMPIYGRESVLNQLKKEFSYIFENAHYPGIPQVDLVPITNQAFKINNTEILPIEVLHYKLPVFGFRIHDFAYITDANYISEEEQQKLQNLDVLVLNALQKEPHLSHFTFDEAVALSQKLNAKKTYFTHISHKLGTHREVSKELPANIQLAYDGLKIEI